MPSKRADCLNHLEAHIDMTDITKVYVAKKECIATAGEGVVSGRLLSAVWQVLLQLP